MGSVSSDDLRRVIEREVGAVIKENDALRSTLVQMDQTLGQRDHDHSKLVGESQELVETIITLREKVRLQTGSLFFVNKPQDFVKT
jgi:hypothetical protein